MAAIFRKVAGISNSGEIPCKKELAWILAPNGTSVIFACSLQFRCHISIQSDWNMFSKRLFKEKKYAHTEGTGSDIIREQI